MSIEYKKISDSFVKDLDSLTEKITVLYGKKTDMEKFYKDYFGSLGYYYYFIGSDKIFIPIYHFEENLFYITDESLGTPIGIIKDNKIVFLAFRKTISKQFKESSNNEIKRLLEVNKQYIKNPKKYITTLSHLDLTRKFISDYIKHRHNHKIFLGFSPLNSWKNKSIIYDEKIIHDLYLMKVMQTNNGFIIDTGINYLHYPIPIWNRFIIHIGASIRRFLLCESNIKGNLLHPHGGIGESLNVTTIAGFCRGSYNMYFNFEDENTTLCLSKIKEFFSDYNPNSLGNSYYPSTPPLWEYLHETKGLFYCVACEREHSLLNYKMQRCAKCDNIKETQEFTEINSIPVYDNMIRNTEELPCDYYVYINNKEVKCTGFKIITKNNVYLDEIKCTLHKICDCGYKHILKVCPKCSGKYCKIHKQILEDECKDCKTKVYPDNRCKYCESNTRVERCFTCMNCYSHCKCNRSRYNKHTPIGGIRFRE